MATSPPQQQQPVKIEMASSPPQQQQQPTKATSSPPPKQQQSTKSNVNKVKGSVVISKSGVIKSKDGLPRPKRPLSAFNLFYRFKRQKALSAISLGKTNIDYIRHLIKCPPGLEDYPPNATNDAATQVVKDLRRYNISKDLDLLPREDTKQRSHRTNQSAMNGAMSFVEMGKIMNATWKSCDDFARGVFDELAEEGRETYHTRLETWKKASEGGGAGPAAMKRKYTKTKKQPVEIIKKPRLEAEAQAETDQPNHKKPKVEVAPSKKCETGEQSKATSSTTARMKTANDYELFIKATKEAKQVHLPGNAANIGPQARTSPLDMRRQSPPNPAFKQDPISNGYDQLLARVAKSNAPHAVPKERLAMPQQARRPSLSQQARPSQGQFQGPPPRHDDTDLRMRIMELEGQLASEQLHARIGQLERDLANHRANQGQLRSMLDARGNSNNSRAAAAAYPPSYSQGAQGGGGGYYEEMLRAQLMSGANNNRGVPSLPNHQSMGLNGFDSYMPSYNQGSRQHYGDMQSAQLRPNAQSRRVSSNLLNTQPAELSSRKSHSPSSYIQQGRSYAELQRAQLMSEARNNMVPPSVLNTQPTEPRGLNSHSPSYVQGGGHHEEHQRAQLMSDAQSRGAPSVPNRQPAELSTFKSHSPSNNVQGSDYHEEMQRAQLMSEARNHRVPPVSNPRPADLSGLESLVQATEIDTTLSKMAATKDASPVCSAMPNSSAQAVGDIKEE